jgi:hypothetical protein
MRVPFPEFGTFGKKWWLPPKMQGTAFGVIYFHLRYSA